jgi:hypothetical protein
MNIPNTIDDATVLLAAVGQGSFGESSGSGGLRCEITALVIAQYPEEPESFYLFACDSEWVVRGDLHYFELDKARTDAARYYGRADIEWQAPLA